MKKAKMTYKGKLIIPLEKGYIIASKGKNITVYKTVEDVKNAIRKIVDESQKSEPRVIGTVRYDNGKKTYITVANGTEKERKERLISEYTEYANLRKRAVNLYDSGISSTAAETIWQKYTAEIEQESERKSISLYDSDWNLIKERFSFLIDYLRKKEKISGAEKSKIGKAESRHFGFAFSRSTESDIIDYLESQESIKAEIKRLIRQEIEKNRKI